jgi:hypothetical protein
MGPLHTMRLMRRAGHAVALLFYALPEARRFDAALAAARVLEPIIGRTRGYRARAALKTDDLHATSLDLLLTVLTRHGVVFTPRLRVDGIDHLPPAGSAPIFIASAHTMLSMHFLRYLEDRGYAPHVLAEIPGLRIPGTRTPARMHSESPSLLFEIRTLMRRGQTLAAMIDRDGPERGPIVTRTSRGPLYLAGAPLQLALRHGAAVVFLSAGLDGDTIVLRLGAPRDAGPGVETVAREFAAFVDAGYGVGRRREVRAS